MESQENDVEVALSNVRTLAIPHPEPEPDEALIGTNSNGDLGVAVRSRSIHGSLPARPWPAAVRGLANQSILAVET
jgi:hypothetical protein